ncbi:MAG: DNA polymerase III subunit gamma/tau, partial [Gammaproteobacteria bacterium]|nr:DNA polymerase III subunit gamma/tau [Gammaproteobacteria bacterium]
QAISFGAGKVSSEQIHQMLGSISQQQIHTLMKALIDHDGHDLLQQSHELSAQGRDFNTVLNELLATLQQIATIQLVPNLEHSDDSDYEQLQSLGQKISPEIVQLFYQIALHGKRDLPYAADPKSGFEMTLLRMLSFQPKVIGTKNHVDLTTTVPPVQTQQKSAQNTSTNPRQVHTELEQNAATTEFQQPEPIQPLQVEEPKAVEVTSDVTPVDSASEILNASNWLSTIGSLKLTAFARQLADNSAFIKSEGDKVTLAIAPELAHLANPKAQERLELVLGKHLDQTIKLIFTQNTEQYLTATATLAAEQSEQAKQNQQQAADSIHNDPAIDALKQTFNARIIESSIKPITEDKK